MSLSVGAGMAIAGGIAAASSAGSAIAQGKLNRKNRKWQEKMYNQRLQDQRADWQMQNEYNEEMYNKYNSPIAQVQQQQAAGLNSDLNGIDSQALPAAGSLPAAPDAGSAPYQMPAMDFVGTFAQMASMFQQIEAASLDNDLKREQIRNSVLPDVLDLAARNYDPDKDTSDDLQIPVLSPKYLRNYFLSRGMSKASSRIAANMFSKLDPKDVIKSYFDKDSGMNKSRTDNAAITGDALFSDNNDTLKSNFKTFSNAIAEFNKLLREAQTSKAKYDKAFYDNSNGGDDATALYNDKQFSAGLKEQAYNKGSNYNKYYKQFDDFAKNLDEQGSFGSFLSFIARILWNKYLEK